MNLELKGGEYLDLRTTQLAALPDYDIQKLENLARILRGLMFISLEASHSGHPGGSSSKVEQLLALLVSGAFKFNPLEPKNSGRDRLIWSAGHCSPLLHSTLALIYEAYKKQGKSFDAAALKAVLAKDLLRFRHIDGPSGHVESEYPLADLCTGASGHGLSGAAGIATLHKSSGLDTKVYVLMGDAETEEGMTYEARNLIKTLGLTNLTVLLDYNHFGIDGNISEVISSEYINHWQGLGWNVIRVNGHDFLQLIYAYRKAAEGFNNNAPCVVIADCIKGKFYGVNENKADSHGKPAEHDDYLSIMQRLNFSVKGEVGKINEDLQVVLDAITAEDSKYFIELLDKSAAQISPEAVLMDKIKLTLKDRPILNPLDIRRPETLPPELVFSAEKPAATRKASEAWFTWLMKQTGFFYIGTGDLSKSILTKKAEDVYGIINPEHPYGRGIRFGIAEQNMAMFSCALTQDRLPGNLQGISTFSSYGVFTSMMANAVRMTLIGNAMNPSNKGFFIMLAAHDGPETGEDGPTHHGLFWMSLFNAYPGIKVYKPLDANETIEMLFYALEKGEPIALSVARPDTQVFDRSKYPSAKLATQGAYVFKDYTNNGGKKRVLAVCGGQTMVNTLAIVPALEKTGLDIKIIAVTSPELFEQFAQENPEAANQVLSAEERNYTIGLHNGWPGFLYPFILSADYNRRALGINKYLKSGPPQEVYQVAEFTPDDLQQKILKAI